ncbi:putative disulfide formation protein [Brevibacillus agri]|uniref:Disulfide bond formation protein B n=1 Tax=Brevibacillus agri TaxID=51101 RepID=A0A3M8AAW8_9BACL|nr:MULTISPECIES: disulfide oxidoreductase [Brevibacillus]ELK40770.1 protein disulfide oxidoreductase [Brevibacillus agri BAB-2500]EJL41625.1 disulfide bond formation protein DsbB [Brevibacillus sp. CF112]MBG9565456.1 disulfide oxidoreductase [Brevibacillus agri]MBY0054692.1 disulfide bond formation protein B [Brevibacillus agri]MCG5251181.1 disulfide oxidoreductase [Brevibacillus agri]
MKRQQVMEQSMFAAWGVSLIATAGSLFFSEVLKYIPCDLCWYQRILMYPLIILLGVASAKKDYKMSSYALILSLIGGCISLYHYLIQKVPALHELGNACGIVPCNTDYINWFGFITIPFLALVAFTLISILLFIVMKNAKEI